MTAMSSPNDPPASTQPTNEKQSYLDFLAEQVRVSQKIDPIINPSHYKTGKYEVIDVIEDWKLGFRLANVVKYVARAEHKGNPLVDLYKALWYLNREIASRERNA
jgi:hypothetical protein